MGCGKMELSMIFCWQFEKEVQWRSVGCFRNMKHARSEVWRGVAQVRGGGDSGRVKHQRATIP
jgi:hypothetical protein